MRGNVARDITEVGTGYGVSSYYLDEGSHDCIVENNVSINVARPTHNHIARNSIIRDNVFISEEDMTLSFQSSAKFRFEGNTLITPAKSEWYRQMLSLHGKTIKFSARVVIRIICHRLSQLILRCQHITVPSRKTRPIEVMRSIKAPALDGELATDEWPGEFQRLDREPSRLPYSGAPVVVKYSWDNKYLYIGAMMTMFDMKYKYGRYMGKR